MGLLAQAVQYFGTGSGARNSSTKPAQSPEKKPSPTPAALPYYPALLPPPRLPNAKSPSLLMTPGVQAAITMPSLNPVLRQATAASGRAAAAHGAPKPILRATEQTGRAGFHPLYALGEAFGGVHPLQALAIRARSGDEDRAAPSGVPPRPRVGDGDENGGSYTLVDWLRQINPRQWGDEETPEGHVGHPAIMRNHSSSAQSGHYHADAQYELWSPAGANAREVVQGRAGDCYWLAALASGLHSGRIKADDLIRPVDGEPDVYEVFFHPPDPKSPTGWSREVEAVRVDACLPHTSTDRHLYADGVDTADDGRVEDAVAIAEKAAAIFAERHGVFCEHLPPDKRKGYDAIGNGGFPGDAISSFTGNATETLFVDRAKSKDVEAMLRGASKEGAMVVIGTRPSPTRPLVGTHAYSVLGIEDEPGEKAGDAPRKMVVLRNPWGIESPWSGENHAGLPSLDEAFDGGGGALDWFLHRDLRNDAHVDPNDPGQFKIPLEDVQRSIFIVTAGVDSPRWMRGRGGNQPNPKPIVF